MTAPRSKMQRAYDYVMERIVDGSLPGGTPLNINSLAEAAGVSLIPMREALRTLESEGFIQFEYHRGVRVRELTIEEYRDQMQVEAVLEALAVSMSAPLLTPAEIQAARDLNRAMDEAYRAKDFHAYSENSLRFHDLLRRPCPNRYLHEQLNRGRNRVAALRATVVGYRGTIAERLSKEHEHLLDRIEAGAEPDEIEALMRAHREGTIAHDSANLRATQRMSEVTQG